MDPSSHASRNFDGDVFHVSTLAAIHPACIHDVLFLDRRSRLCAILRGAYVCDHRLLPSLFCASHLPNGTGHAVYRRLSRGHGHAKGSAVVGVTPSRPPQGERYRRRSPQFTRGLLAQSLVVVSLHHLQYTLHPFVHQ